MSRCKQITSEARKGKKLVLGHTQSSEPHPTHLMCNILHAERGVQDSAVQGISKHGEPMLGGGAPRIQGPWGCRTQTMGRL